MIEHHTRQVFAKCFAFLCPLQLIYACFWLPINSILLINSPLSISELYFLLDEVKTIQKALEQTHTKTKKYKDKIIRGSNTIKEDKKDSINNYKRTRHFV